MSGSVAQRRLPEPQKPEAPRERRESRRSAEWGRSMIAGRQCDDETSSNTNKAKANLAMA